MYEKIDIIDNSIAINFENLIAIKKIIDLDCYIGKDKFYVNLVFKGYDTISITVNDKKELDKVFLEIVEKWKSLG